VQALHTYKNHRSLIALFDSISICADFVGSPTGHQNLCCMYLPPLVQMWTSANPLDRRLLSLMESISCIALAIGLEIQPYALTIFDQCMLCIEACTIQVHTEDNATEEDCDFIVCATDIVDAMVEGMGGASFSTLLSSSRYADHFLNIVLGLCRSQVPGVRMSSFALIGDLTRNCANILQPAISEFVRESIRCIDVMHGSVCNNSLWALGEICVKCQDNHGVIDPFAADILRALVPILMGNGAQGNISSIPGLAENAASCLGRLSMVRAAYVSQELSTILPGWCEGLARISDQTERLDGFTGLMHVIYANPQAIIQHPSYISSLVFAVASWHIPPNENGIPFVTNEMLNGSQYKFLPFPQDAADLGQALAKLLTEIKTGIGEEHWEDIMKRTPINLRKLLSQTYGV